MPSQLDWKGRECMPPKKTTILVVDDDVQLLKIVTHNLEAEGYQVRAVRDGAKALEAIERDAPLLVLLDVMLPRMDGFQVCQRAREFSAVPIIMITARGRGQDKVKGLDLGADDYLTKPFRVDEMLARVRAVLRRGQFTTNGHAQSLRAATTIGELTFDYAQHRVTKAGREVALTPTEYRILAYLAQNAGRVVTQDLLLEHVWGRVRGRGPHAAGEHHPAAPQAGNGSFTPPLPAHQARDRLPARQGPRCAGGTLKQELLFV
jgi:DNA-binding response OmpR family regulator